MSESSSARQHSDDDAETIDRCLSSDLDRRDSFDRFQYVQGWIKELHLPPEDVQQEEQSSFVKFLFTEEEVADFTEKQNYEREELERAKDCLRPAERLRREGYLFDSMLCCATTLREQLGKWTRPINYSDYGTILMRQCILQLILVFCETEPAILLRRRDDHYPMNHEDFLLEVVEEQLETKFVAVLYVLRDICAYCIISARGFKGQDTMQRILNDMQSIYLIDDPETLLAQKYLAESFVFDGYHGIPPEDLSCFAEREEYIQRHSHQLTKTLGLYDPACLRYDHAIARILLNHSKQYDAKTLLRNIFDRRETAFGEQHAESQKMIDKILDADCEEYEGNPSDSYNEFFDCAFIDNLVEYCLKREAYVEVDTLVQECVFSREDTTSDSDDCEYRRWAYFASRHMPKVQPRLASHQTPGGGWYWEDSRMYFCTWDKVTLVPDYPEDQFPRAPIRLSSSHNTISIELSDLCLADFESIQRSNGGPESSPVSCIHNSEIWQLLESKRQSGDWKILLALGLQDIYCKVLVQGDVNHRFWLFWDEVIEKEDNIAHSDGSYSRTYRFHNVDETKPEWLIVDSVGPTVHSKEDGLDPHEPIAGDPNGQYIVKNKYFFGSDEFPKRPQIQIPGSLKYKIHESRKNYIDIDVPLTSYEHFRCSRAYREGLNYVEYLDYLHKRASGDQEPNDMKLKWCKGDISGRQELPIWHLSDKETRNYSIRRGFFNGIPTGLGIITNQTSTGGIYNMISSDWIDWKTYTLHKADMGNIPLLQLPSGQCVNCQGYITGTWTEDGQLRKQWSGLQFFVMDCEFGVPESTERHTFILDSTMLADENLHLMSGPEKKFFCGKLSISLFRYAPAPARYGASFWTENRKKKKIAASTMVEETFWGEMNRREKWDREYEKRLNVGPPRPIFGSLSIEFEEARHKWLTGMEAEKEVEGTARRAWDARNRARAEQ